MLPINSRLGIGHCALSHTRVPPRGTSSRIISLRLHRRSRLSCIYRDSLSQWQNLPGLARGAATTTSSTNAISDQEFMLFRDLVSRGNPKFEAENYPSDAISSDMNSEAPIRVSTPKIGTSDGNDPMENISWNPLLRALKALQQRNTRGLLISLRQIARLGETDLRELVATLPRTTFTEFFRALDPLHIAKTIDPTDRVLVTVGVFQVLSMESNIDDWGVRKIYSQLLRALLGFVSALKAAGYSLHIEEYIYLLRCAGAASDPAGAKLIWDELLSSPTGGLRHGGVFVEFLSARFLTNPLYTGYDKTKRMVIPRNLHRSRMFHFSASLVKRLDRLRFNTRIRRLRFGLNKDREYAEDIMRTMRRVVSPMRMLHYLQKDGYKITEAMICTIMIAFGRTGSLRYIGSRILWDYFSIPISLVYSRNPEIRRAPSRIRPTRRLMEAVVETYGSNGEISLAIQLVNYISRTYHIPIPLSIWQDLLEWTHVMSSPPASTAWKKAKMPRKIPDTLTIELIWNTMLSAPYHVRPGFDQYNILIRNLLGRRLFNKPLLLMRQAVQIYNNQCREYEEAALEYVQMVRDGLIINKIATRYERARFTKGRMYYDIQGWCRRYLSAVRSSDPANPLATVAVPDFILEFQPFIENPARYRTATGYVSLIDPAREIPVKVLADRVRMDIPMKHKRRWVLQRVKRKKLQILSSNSLAGNAPVSKVDLMTLLTSTSRLPKTQAGRLSKKNAAKRTTEPATVISLNDDDDDYI